MSKVGAPYGNKNAEKWTEEDARKLFEDAIELTDEEETFYLKTPSNKAVQVVGKKFDFIGEIARELKTFHEIFDHLLKRFPNLEMLSKVLRNNIEQNCYSNTKKGVIREATGIVNLKSNWKWTDRQDLTSQGERVERPLFGPLGEDKEQ